MGDQLGEIDDDEVDDWDNRYGFDLRPLLALSPDGRAAVDRLAAAMRTPLTKGDPLLHHYVAQSYQRRFSKGDEIVRIRLADPGRLEVLSVQVVAAFKNLYTVVADGIGETVMVERILAQIDGDVVGVMDRLALGVIFPPSRADRLKLAIWAAMQRLRTPAMRRNFEAISDSLFKTQLSLVNDEASARAHLRRVESREPDDDEVEALLDAVAEMDAWEITPHQNEMVRAMLDGGLSMVGFFLGRLTTVVKFAEPGLIISDNPVVLRQEPGHRSDWPPASVATADEIIVPLDRSTVVILHSNEVSGEQVINAPPHLTVDYLNQIIAGQAHSEIYCHPDDVWRLDNLTLHDPDRPLLTVSGGGWVRFATDGVNKPPIRKKHRRYRKPSREPHAPGDPPES